MTSGQTIPLTPDNAHLDAMGLPSHARIRKMSLFIAKGQKAGSRTLIHKNRFVVGKGNDCDLQFVDATVSRQHFEIVQEGEAFWVRDLGSTNGTVVDGLRVKDAALVPGARISIGRVELIFQPIFEALPPEEDLCDEFGGLLAVGASMKSILGMLRKAGQTGTTVLLRGETGVGKSALAKALHAESNRKTGPFVVFDCGAVAPTLIESELFGVKKGAFTGAYESRPGACEQADGGMLLIDEIGDLPLEMQAKLLRVIEEREVRRLGDTRPIKLDIRITAATTKDLDHAVRQGTFRRDLYYRIAVLEVVVPPLRLRKEDIPVLGHRFLTQISKTETWDKLAPELKEELISYHWPGNIRELRNALERLVFIGPCGLPSASSGAPPEEINPSLSPAFDMDRPFKEAKDELLEAFETEYLKRLLERHDGCIAPAAREAGLNRKYFYDLLRKHHLNGREST